MSKAEDRASEEEDAIRERMIEQERSHKYVVADATGFCLYCGEQFASDNEIENFVQNNVPLVTSQRWCDNFCRDDWQAITKAR